MGIWEDTWFTLSAVLIIYTISITPTVNLLVKTGYLLTYLLILNFF